MMTVTLLGTGGTQPLPDRALAAACRTHRGSTTHHATPQIPPPRPPHQNPTQTTTTPPRCTPSRPPPWTPAAATP